MNEKKRRDLEDEKAATAKRNKQWLSVNAAGSSAMEMREQRDGVQILEAPALATLIGSVHGFSTRRAE